MAQQLCKQPRRTVVSILLTFAMWLAHAGSGNPQVTTNITATQPPIQSPLTQPNFSLGTVVSQDGNTTIITGGTQAGTSLFHSFDAFNVGTASIAQFQSNPNQFPASDIIARVIGGRESQIDGTIQTVGFGNANLWFMNPAGIMFGENAKLDIGGSVVFTTANRLESEADQQSGFFGTATTAQFLSAFSVANVVEFGFFPSSDSTAPGTISITESKLTLPPNQTLAFVGGDINVTGGTLQVPNGSIRLTSVSYSDLCEGPCAFVARDPTTGAHGYDLRFDRTLIPGIVTLSQSPKNIDTVIDTGSTGQIQLNGVIYNGTNATSFINPQPPNIVIANGSILVGNLPPTRLIVSSPSVLVSLPTNNDTSTPSLSNLSAVATASRPSPHQLIMASDRCSGSEKGAFSSFVPPGRDAARPQPGGPLASPPYLEDEIPHITEIPIQSTVRIAGTRNLASGATAFLPRIGGC